MRSRRVPAHASICYKSRGLAAAPGPAAQGGETRATQGDGYEVVALGERLRGISLGSSGDPIIHMWITEPMTVKPESQVGHIVDTIPESVCEKQSCTVGIGEGN